MTRTATLFTVAVAACTCPTVWLNVTRSGDAPAVPPSTAADLASRPIAVPETLPNRFDLVGAIPSDAAHLYQERTSSVDDPIDALSRAVAGRTAILDALGVPLDVETVGSAPTFRAWVVCDEDGGDRVCEDLELRGVAVGAELGVEPTVAMITRMRDGKALRWLRVVDTCEGLGDLRLEHEIPPGEPPCGPVRREGTQLGITETLPTELFRDGDVVDVTVAAELPPAHTLLTFVQISDAQIRDPVVKLGDPRLSAALDRVIPSFEQDEDQARYSAQVTESIVARINAHVTARRDAGAAPADVPRFVLHSGDAIDAGTFRELDRFIELMDRLQIPWFNALGNHDTLVFGNMLPIERDDDGDAACVSLRSVAAPYPVPLKKREEVLPGALCVDGIITAHDRPTGKGAVEHRDRFIAQSDHQASRTAFIAAHQLRRSQAVPIERERRHGYDSATCNQLIRLIDSKAHGFDLVPPKPEPDEPDRTDHTNGGYYAFAVPVSDGTPTQRNAVMIVLNTEDLEQREGGNSGRLRAQQLRWLEDVMGCTRDTDLVMIAAHHQPSEIKLPDGGVLRTHRVLRPEQDNIVAFLYGHKHKHGICRDNGACGKPYLAERESSGRIYTRFWELETGSLLEHPQEGRLIRIARLGGDVGFIETTVFGEALIDRGSPLAQAVELARRGAERDHCAHPWEYACSGDGRVRRVDARDSHARLFFRLPGAAAAPQRL